MALLIVVRRIDAGGRGGSGPVGRTIKVRRVVNGCSVASRDSGATLQHLVFVPRGPDGFTADVDRGAGRVNGLKFADPPVSAATPAGRCPGPDPVAMQARQRHRKDAGDLLPSSGGQAVVVAAPAGRGPGRARGAGLRPAAALPATRWRRRLPGRRFAEEPVSEGQDDGVVVGDRRNLADGGVDLSGGYSWAAAGEAPQTCRSGETGGEGSERGGGVADAHVCLIGSPGVRRNPPTGQPLKCRALREGRSRAVRVFLASLMKRAEE